MNSPEYPVGRILHGDAQAIGAARERFQNQPLDDIRLHDGPYPFPLQ